MHTHTHTRTHTHIHAHTRTTGGGQIAIMRSVVGLKKDASTGENEKPDEHEFQRADDSAHC